MYFHTKQHTATHIRTRKSLTLPPNHSEVDFRALAEARQQEVEGVFQRLLAFSVPPTDTADTPAHAQENGNSPAGENEGVGLHGGDEGGGEREREMEELVTTANEVSDWFPGGSKEVKRRFATSWPQVRVHVRLSVRVCICAYCLLWGGRRGVCLCAYGDYW